MMDGAKCKDNEYFLLPENSFSRGCLKVENLGIIIINTLYRLFASHLLKVIYAHFLQACCRPIFFLKFCNFSKELGECCSNKDDNPLGLLGVSTPPQAILAQLLVGSGTIHRFGS